MIIIMNSPFQAGDFFTGSTTITCSLQAMVFLLNVWGFLVLVQDTTYL